MDGYQKREKCASCNSKNLHQILNLGDVPLAGYFPNEDQLKDESSYPLKLLFCNDCKLVQTDSVINPDIMFKEYRYISSIGLSKHFNELAQILDRKYNIINKKILEIGCNDGVLLKPLQELGADVYGVDPATNIIKLARDKGLNVVNDYFSYEKVKDDLYRSRYDFVLANNTFAHIIDIQSVVKGIKHILKPNGHFIFEVHYLKNLIEDNQWDNIYHEHIYYYSISALKNMFEKYNMTVIDFEEIPIHSGSIRVTVVNDEVKSPDKVLNRIGLESVTLCNTQCFENYNKVVNKHISNFKSLIKELSSKYKIAGYGASGRANMFCNLTDLNKDIVQFIVDESPERCNRYIANTDIPIVDVETLKNSDVDLLIIFAWNYSKMIIDKTQFKDFKYLVAFPSVQLVDNYDELEGFESI